jgi:hypothetical protein
MAALLFDTRCGVIVCHAVSTITAGEAAQAAEHQLWPNWVGPVQ